jgi:hypothetical protein
MIWNNACENAVEAEGLPVQTWAPTALWKVVPTEKVGPDGNIIFRLINAAKGEVTVVNYHRADGFATINSWYTLDNQVTGASLPLLGITFFGVNPNNPQLWILRDGQYVHHRMFLVVDVSKITRAPTADLKTFEVEYYSKPNCNRIYRVGYQEEPDRNDVATCTFSPHMVWSQVPGNFYIPAITFGPNTLGQRIGACVATQCDGRLGDNESCRNYVATNSGDATLSFLGPYCRDSEDHALNDPLCSIWCRAGLTEGNGEIRQQCINVRKKACAQYYDPDTKTWKVGTSSDTKSKCSCYMPEEYYKSILGQDALPTNPPSCYYQPCADSAIGSQSYGGADCSGVRFCVQGDGERINTNCLNSFTNSALQEANRAILPTSNGADVVAATSPITRRPLVMNDMPWLWIFLAVIVVFAIGVALVWLTSRARKSRKVAVTREEEVPSTPTLNNILYSTPVIPAYYPQYVRES